MPIAAVMGDNHVCPMVTGTVPHVGGPLVGPGEPTVLIGGKPAAVLGDTAVCVGPPDSVAMGSFTVLIGGKPAVRVGDTCGHGGVVVGPGVPTVMIG
ncbi:PAAR domain-containing protein [Reichenbachiella carrageenanivorans]|uniref:PAAR domain-containing protein n=1 Tax=Reichenbachiella carrageenanivorans TaxID=2979869 RepID=A0ABY6D1J9_9BACT|nr:PAAR domain-containing protein [Reichenbachiella carrageenanivorans]UXX77735.1 PAAR domain-containing protein [Reichenbachiella carrageenanivorans]